MTRYGLRDAQWERMKELLPGKAGDIGVPRETIAGLWRRSCTDTARESHGATCRNAWATGRTRTGGSAAGPRAECGRGCLRRLRIFGQRDKLRADRSKGRETWRKEEAAQRGI